MGDGEGAATEEIGQGDPGGAPPMLVCTTLRTDRSERCPSVRASTGAAAQVPTQPTTAWGGVRPAVPPWAGPTPRYIAPQTSTTRLMRAARIAYPRGMVLAYPRRMFMST